MRHGKTLLNITTSFLSRPFCYESFHKIFGKNKCYRILLDEYIKPFDGIRILDIGCGTAEILNHLPEVKYIGFDSSESYITAARHHFGKRGVFLRESLSDAGADNLSKFGQFDLVMSNGVLHHLTDRQAVQLFALSFEVLKEGGKLFTFDGCFTDSQSIITRALLKMDRGKHIRTEDQYFNLARLVYKDVKKYIRNDMLNIPYTLLILECTKE